jgi:hypothetical protein
MQARAGASAVGVIPMLGGATYSRQFAAPGPHIMSGVWQATGTAHSTVNEK